MIDCPVDIQYIPLNGNVQHSMGHLMFIHSKWQAGSDRGQHGPGGLTNWGTGGDPNGDSVVAAGSGANAESQAELLVIGFLIEPIC